MKKRSVVRPQYEPESDQRYCYQAENLLALPIYAESSADAARSKIENCTSCSPPCYRKVIPTFSALPKLTSEA